METRKSVWAEMTFLKILFFWLIIPVLVAVIVAKCYRVSIKERELVLTTGVLSKSEKTYPLAGVKSISISQSLWGRMFKYGNVKINLGSEEFITLEGVVKPYDVKYYLDKLIKETAEAKIVTAI